jgi:hypothetical protein
MRPCVDDPVFHKNLSVFLTTHFLGPLQLPLFLRFNFLITRLVVTTFLCGCYIIRYISILCFLIIINVNMADARTGTTSRKVKGKTV